MAKLNDDEDFRFNSLVNNKWLSPPSFNQPGSCFNLKNADNIDDLVTGKNWKAQG